jgi:hypothetical protein
MVRASTLAVVSDLRCVVAGSGIVGHVFGGVVAIGARAGCGVRRWVGCRASRTDARSHLPISGSAGCTSIERSIGADLATLKAAGEQIDGMTPFYARYTVMNCRVIIVDCSWNGR